MPARVLVVDDVEVNVRLLEAKLSGEYFSVLSAYNGFTALEVAEAELPDVIPVSYTHLTLPTICSV